MAMRNIWTMLLAAGICCGIATIAMADVPPPKEEPKKEEPKAEKLELPWTADDIKKRLKKGTACVYKQEMTRSDNATTLYVKLEITEVSDEGCTQKMSMLDAEKKDTGKSMDEKQKWAEFGRTKFTKADTTVTEEKIKVGA